MEGTKNTPIAVIRAMSGAIIRELSVRKSVVKAVSANAVIGGSMAVVSRRIVAHVSKSINLFRR